MAETTVRGQIGDKEIVFKAGKLAGLANGAVTASIGQTEMLVTAAANSSIRQGIDFFPLTVDVEERMYAAGKIPGSFFRREGRATERAILTARLIDRPLRPSFAPRLPQRHPRRRNDLSGRQREPLRHRRTERCVGRALDQRHPVRGPPGWSSTGADRWRVEAIPDV